MKIRIMERYRIIILFLVIHFVEGTSDDDRNYEGEIIPNDDDYYVEVNTSEDDGYHYEEDDDEDYEGEDLFDFIRAENKLFDRLILDYSKRIPGGFIVNDRNIFQIVYFYYALFWESVNLRIRALVYKSRLVSEQHEGSFQQTYEAVFENTSKVFKNVKELIRNYYNTMQNKEIICGSTFLQSDSDAAENVWNELLKLNLNFIMSTDTLVNTSSDNEYTDGLVKWSEIEETNSFKTLLPTNSPDEIDILKLSPDEEESIKDYEFLQRKWCEKLMDFINTEINDNILECFFTKLTDISKKNLNHKHAARLFMFTECPDEKKIRHYLRIMKDFFVGALPVVIEMVRFTRKQTNLAIGPKNKLIVKKQKLEDQQWRFIYTASSTNMYRY